MAQQTDVIIVEGVSKHYSLDANYRTTFVEALKNFVVRALGAKPTVRLGNKVAVQGISFTVPKGLTLGIIGRNGSGKSTLLRMLAGITQPTTGSITIHGKVTSILDIGSGFIADLTGRENVLMASSLMGMTTDAISQRMNEIITFSEIGEYIDVPVKYYSSGMYLRLAFSLAVHVDMDVLLIDEVIEVGDESFQIKCHNKLKQLTGLGYTVLICTHNMRSVAELCSHCLVMEQGKVIAYGHAHQMVEEYLENIWSKSYELDAGSIKLAYTKPDFENLPTNPWVEMLEMRLAQTDSQDVLYTEKELHFTFRYRKLQPDAALHASVWVFDATHRPILSGNSMPLLPQSQPDATGVYEMSVVFPAYFFNKGLFFMRLHFVKGNEQLLHEHPQLLPFRMHQRHIDPTNLKIDGRVGSPLYMKLPWQKQYLG